MTMPHMIVATSRGGVAYDDMLIASDDGVWRNHSTATWTRILAGSWTVAISPYGMSSVLFALNSYVGISPSFQSSADGGLTWVDLSANLPALTGIAAFFTWVAVADGSATDLYLSMWTFHDPANASTVFHSTDGGVSWSALATGSSDTIGADYSIACDIKDRGSPSYLLYRDDGSYRTNPQPANSPQNRKSTGTDDDQAEYRGMQVRRGSTQEWYWSDFDTIGSLFTPKRAALLLDSSSYGRGSWVESYPGLGGSNLSGGWWVEPISATQAWIVYSTEGPPFTTYLSVALVTLTGGTYGPIGFPSGQVSTFYNVSFGPLVMSGTYYWGPSAFGLYNHVYRPFALGRTNPNHLWWLAGSGAVEYSPDGGVTVQSQSLIGMSGNNANTIWPLG